MRMPPRAAPILWAVFVAVCAGWLYRNLAVGTDLTVFLPPSTTASQRMLVSQLRDGVAARLILIGLEGETSTVLAQASHDLVRQLRASGRFAFVNNGDPAGASREQEVLVAYRYLLSPEVRAERFTSEGLAVALNETLALFASPAGPFLRKLLTIDPTGETRHVIELLGSRAAPELRHGVWFSRDGKRALLVAETGAAGFDIDSQARAIEAIRGAFQASAARNATLLMSGTGVFAAQARDTIRGEAQWLAAVAAVLVALILAAVYRAAAPLAFSIVPVATGMLAGVAAVSAAFGTVHGITLGFGVTLIGEAVDYPSYTYLQAARGERLADTLARIGPTLRLAVLTTVLGASAMALSSFQGLAQLGLLTIVGVGVAGLTTRWVLPVITPAHAYSRTLRALSFAVPVSAFVGRRGRGVVALTVAGALAIIAWHYERLWDDNLANLSPLPEAARNLDRSLRNELGAPDLRYLVVARGNDREAALVASEAASAWLREAVDRGWIAGYDLPSHYLPSRKTQERRQAALPDAATLARNLETAMRDSPFREGLFAPFLEAVERARTGPLLAAENLRGSAFGLRVDSLLVAADDGWAALGPVRAVTHPAELAAAARAAGHELLDLKAESEGLVNSYRGESLRLIALGLLAIAALLAWGLRSLIETARVLFPVLAALVLDVALLLLWGKRLTLFNLVALLLVVGIGLNYALFFNRPAASAEERSRTLLSLVVCGATTLAAFGCLAFSRTPVLHDIGLTVTLGAALSFVTSALLASPKAQRGPA